MDNALNTFIDNLIKARNFPKMEDAVMSQIKEDLKNNLQDFIQANLIKELDDDQVDKLSKLMDTNPTEEEVSKFWQDNIVDFKTTMTQIFLNFKNIYLN